MKLGIIGAMDIEVETLRSALRGGRTVRRAGIDFYCGCLEGVDAVVCRCGVGKVQAAMCTQILCDLFEVTHLVNTGVAGSLRPSLEIGDLLISTDAMYHDLDCRAVGYPVGQVPGLETLAFPADETLVALAQAAAEAVCPGHSALGRVASGDQFICSRAQKERILASTEAFCAEMEGAAIAHTAWQNGVPYVILRAISDRADGSAAQDYPAFEALAARRCADVVCRLARLLGQSGIEKNVM